MKSRTHDALQKSADEYLNVEFGWKPLADDANYIRVHHPVGDDCKTIRRRFGKGYPQEVRISYRDIDNIVDYRH